MSNFKKLNRAKVKKDGPLISGFGNAGAIFGDHTDEAIHPQILKMARKSGNLNLANKALAKVPERVYHLNELDEEEKKLSKSVSMDNSDDKWWEQVDLTKLYLNSNVLTTIDSLISNLGALQLLDLSDNRINSLPETMGDLQRLTKLNLSHNNLSSLPSSLGKMEDLRHLSIDHNKFTELPEEIGSLCVLETLDASLNTITSLPKSIGFLQRLNKLVLRDNKITELPEEIGDMFCLAHLDLTRNQISVLPKSLSNLPKLEELCLRQNKITSFPKIGCPTLKELYLGMNQIKLLPVECLECVAGLRVLDISSNGLDELPNEITLLQHLSTLDLSNNYLSNLPGHLGFLPHLKSMPLEGNPLRLIRRDIVQRGTSALLKFLSTKITEPVKSYPGFSDYIPEDCPSDEKPIPDQYEMRNLRSMVYNEKCDNIPDKLFENGRLAQVRTVDFSRNGLTSVPEKIVDLSGSVNDLILVRNKLPCLSPIVAQLKYLQFINVQNNFLTDLPMELSSLKQMREINFAFNKFKEFPEVLYEMPTLEIIFASDNKITEIKAEKMLQIERLATLDLHNNDIGFVPPLLGKMTQIKALQLEGNAFRVPRYDIMAKGTNFLMEYLRSRIVE